MHTLHDLIKFQPLFCDLYLPTSFVFFWTFSAVFLVNEQQRLVPITIYFWSLFCAIYSVFIWYEERRVASMKSWSWWNLLLQKKHLFESLLCTDLLFLMYSIVTDRIHKVSITTNSHKMRTFHVKYVIYEIPMNSEKFAFFLQKDAKIAHREIIPN